MDKVFLGPTCPSDPVNAELRLTAVLSLPVTLGSALAGVLLAALFGWLGARAPDLRRGPRMLPYRFLMLLAAAWVLLMLVHVANLLGVRTGR